MDFRMEMNKELSEFEEYALDRNKKNSIKNYGLLRRTIQLNKIITEITKERDQRLRIVDFGCADCAMLLSIMNDFQDKIELALGVDVFEFDLSPEVKKKGIKFQIADLFEEYPYPFADESQDIIIASSIFKHHPEPVKFLIECQRILSKNGHLIIIDPCPWVVKLGLFLNYFNPTNNGNIWNKKSVLSMIQNSSEITNLNEYFYERYWLAPNRISYDLKLESICPSSLIRYFGLHQSLVIQKT